MVAEQTTLRQPNEGDYRARIRYHRVGEFVELADLTVESLSALIHRVLDNPEYGQKACYFKKVIAETHGLDVAAEILERAFFPRSEQRLCNGSPRES